MCKCSIALFGNKWRVWVDVENVFTRFVQLRLELSFALCIRVPIYVVSRMGMLSLFKIANVVYKSLLGNYMTFVVLSFYYERLIAIVVVLWKHSFKLCEPILIVLAEGVAGLVWRGFCLTNSPLLLNFLFKIKQLPLETGIWINDWSFRLYERHCIEHAHAVLLHQIGNY